MANLKPGGDTSFSERRAPSAAVQVLDRGPALCPLTSNWGERRGGARSSGAPAAGSAVPGPKNSGWSLSAPSVLVKEPRSDSSFSQLSRQGLVYGMWSPPPPIRASLRPSLPDQKTRSWLRIRAGYLLIKQVSPRPLRQRAGPRRLSARRQPEEDKHDLVYDPVSPLRET